MGGADPAFWGAIFLIFSRKMAFWGDVCLCRENRLFGEVFVEKMDYAGDKMKTIAKNNLAEFGGRKGPKPPKTPKFSPMGLSEIPKCWAQGYVLG